ncbi:MAG: hypothetical protein ACFFEE_12190, partial [Candidatus Thorarchaeota archaeon]
MWKGYKTMAWPEDDEPYQPQKPQYASPLMKYDTYSLFALVLQFGIGVIAIYYALPGFITTILLISYVADLNTQIFMIVWGILPF